MRARREGCRALSVAAGLAAVAVALAAACNPIFGIVSRTAGPTWCEETANATVDGFCDDFDRGDDAATAQALAASVNATVSVTGDVSSSPPSSLSIQSTAVAADTGVLAGYLVSFGAATQVSELPAFECQIDVLGSDLTAAANAGATVGFLAVGGQAADCMRAPVVAALGYGPAGFALTLEELPGPDVPPVAIGAPYVIGVPQGALGDGWITLTVFVAPNGYHDASIEGSGRALGESDGGAQASCGIHSHDAGSKGGYAVLVRLGPIDVGAALLPDEGFVEPLMAFGGFALGPAPALTLHVDNVRCTVGPTTSGI